MRDDGGSKSPVLVHSSFFAPLPLSPRLTREITEISGCNKKLKMKPHLGLAAGTVSVRTIRALGGFTNISDGKFQAQLRRWKTSRNRDHGGAGFLIECRRRAPEANSPRGWKRRWSHRSPNPRDGAKIASPTLPWLAWAGGAHCVG